MSDDRSLEPAGHRVAFERGVEYWRERALKAETEVERLQEWAQRLVDADRAIHMVGRVLAAQDERAMGVRYG